MQKTKGISLIVLVITIIVMIILAGAVVISLNNSGIIGRAENAVEESNLATVKQLANLAWAEAYADGARTEQELSDAVEAALAKNNITEDKYKGYTILVTTSGVNIGKKELNPNGVIPEGGIYYVGVTSATLGDYTGATATYTAGDNFPATVSDGDVYVYGDYEYRYNQTINIEFGENVYEWVDNNAQKGWGVRVRDKEQTTYGLVLESINNKNITSMNKLFYVCFQLTELPEEFAIPNGVADVSHMFVGTTSMTKLPENFSIPNSVRNMSYMFSDCALTELPDGFTIPSGVTNIRGVFDWSVIEELPESFRIPNGVTDVSNMFSFSTITKLPEGFTIPSSVTNMENAFSACSSLTGTITINANPTTYTNCFENTKQLIELTGTSNLLDELAATANNGNVTVKK